VSSGGAVDPRPVIGILAHSGPMKQSVYDMPAAFVPQVFVDRVLASGCMPLLLPPVAGAEILVGRLDGLLLLPGMDVDPAFYTTDPPLPQTRSVWQRDVVELGLLRAAMSSALPVLGVCRGAQLINVCRGGTLHQDLAEVGHTEEHLPSDVIFGAQRVRLSEGSHLAAMFGGDPPVVPCHHHQAIARLGTGLAATAWAADGIIEAVEATDYPFLVGVQWHAEQARDGALFAALSRAAAARRDAVSTV
jgi:putative glutamine amidotransferase